MIIHINNTNYYDMFNLMVVKRKIVSVISEISFITGIYLKIEGKRFYAVEINT